MAKITFKNIQTLAKDVKKYVEKNAILPSSLKIDKTEYSYPQIGHILAKSVANIGKDITVIKVNKAPDKTGETVKLDLSKTEYLKEAKEYYQFIEEKGRLPNYSSIKGKKVKQRVMIYSLAKILVWYGDHKKTLPDTCRFYTSETVKKTSTTKTTTKTTTTNAKKKYGHATKSGCDQRGQNNGYYCGCHSLQEVFRNLTGKVVPQKTIASVCGTTTSGTDHDGLNTCVAWFNKKYGFNLKVEWKNFSDLGWSGVKKIVNSDNKDCVIHNLYRNKWGHYEVINSISDSNIKVQNSLGDKCSSGCYCGYVENRPPATFRNYIAGISQKSVMVITKN